MELGSVVDVVVVNDVAVVGAAVVDVAEDVMVDDVSAASDPPEQAASHAIATIRAARRIVENVPPQRSAPKMGSTRPRFSPITADASAA